MKIKIGRITKIISVTGVVLIMAASCGNGKVVKRRVVWNCAVIGANGKCDRSVGGAKTDHYMIEVQLDPTDVSTVEWDDVSPAIYNACFVGAVYPKCTGTP